MNTKTADLDSAGLDESATTELLQALTAHAFDSVIVTTAEHVAHGYPIVFVNPGFTQMTGYSAQEVIGKTPHILQGPKTDQAVLEQLRDDLTRGRPFHGKTINYRKNGSEFLIEWKVIPVHNKAGEVTHYLAIQRDITNLN